MIADKKTRVLIVDDSAVVRRSLQEMLGTDPTIEVVGTACDPYVARDKILSLKPDVITLDVEMPRMDGITFLRILQKHHPLPVVIISSVTQSGSHAAMEALEAGAVDVLAKPSSVSAMSGLATQLNSCVKAAASARRGSLFQVRAPAPPPAPRLSSDGSFSNRQVIVFGASTGGTEALKQVLTQLPDGLPGIAIVQHIPPYFSKSFADRLNQTCAFEVREAADGDELHPGLALVAPGDYHLVLCRTGDRYKASIRQGPVVNHSRPSVDVLFNSVAPLAGSNALAVLLTGMGRDGAQGMKRLKELGATTIAQNEETCVVYGMPRAAVEIGAVDKVLPLDEIPAAILRSLRSQKPVAA